MLPPDEVGPAGDQVEGRALAGAVRTDQRDDLAGLNVERDIVQPRSRRDSCSVFDLSGQHGGVGRGPWPRRQFQGWVGPFAAWLDRQPRHQPWPHTGRRRMRAQKNIWRGCLGVTF